MMHFKTFYVEVSIICKRIKMGGGGGQCSPQNLAQQVRDCSWAVTQKNVPEKHLLSWGKGVVE